MSQPALAGDTILENISWPEWAESGWIIFMDALFKTPDG